MAGSTAVATFFGFPTSSSGLLVSGTSMATVIALAAWESLLPDPRQSLSIGMLLRWWAALSEIRRYYQIPEESRVAGLDRFSDDVIEMMRREPHLDEELRQARIILDKLALCVSRFLSERQAG